VPYGHDKNPPVTKAAVWPSAHAQTLAENACYDCHSNLTKRWSAAKIAPASWLAQSDVTGGRNALNFSAWDKPQAAFDQVVEAVQGGSMPPPQYKLLHSDSRLSSTERQQLVDGLEQLYATDPPAGTKHGGASSRLGVFEQGVGMLNLLSVGAAYGILARLRAPLGRADPRVHVQRDGDLLATGLPLRRRDGRQQRLGIRADGRV